MQPSDAGKEPSELDVMFPVPHKVTIAGREVEVPEATFRMCGMVRARGRVLLVGLALLPDLDLAASTIEIARYAELAECYPAETAELLHAGTGLDQEWIASLSAIDKCELAAAWIEVNADFFRRWLHMQTRLDAAVGSLANGGGSTSSASSGTADITTPKATPRGKSAPTTARSSAKPSGNGAIA